MQYAAILLAQTYHRFGYTRLSLQATEEAIRVAQQSGDGECVAFANGWLALAGNSLGNGGADGGREGSGGERGGAGTVYASVGCLDSNAGGSNNYRPLARSSSTSYNNEGNATSLSGPCIGTWPGEFGGGRLAGISTTNGLSTTRRVWRRRVRVIKWGRKWSLVVGVG